MLFLRKRRINCDFLMSLTVINVPPVCPFTRSHVLGQSLRSIRVVHRPKYKGPLSMDCRERGSHARGVYPTRDTLRMGTARVKQEEEDTRIIVID